MIVKSILEFLAYSVVLYPIIAIALGILLIPVYLTVFYVSKAFHVKISQEYLDGIHYVLTAIFDVLIVFDMKKDSFGGLFGKTTQNDVITFNIFQVSMFTASLIALFIFLIYRISKSYKDQIEHLKNDNKKYSDRYYDLTSDANYYRQKVVDAASEIEYRAQIISQQRNEIERLHQIINKNTPCAPAATKAGTSNQPPQTAPRSQRKTTDGARYPEFASFVIADQMQFSPPQYAYPHNRQSKLTAYWTSEKSNEEIGRDYETFISYLYSKEGYIVDEFGARYQKADQGIDLIAKRGFETLIIQCKCWASTSLLRSNVIFQLDGSLHWYCLNHPNEQNVSGVVVTSAPASKHAKNVAAGFGIAVRENIKFYPFPSVKCHSIFCEDTGNYNGLYYLPFDSEYHNIQMDTESGDQWVHTVEEAESKGFVRNP